MAIRKQYGDDGIQTADHHRPKLHEILGVEPQPWMENALCVQTDPEAFYPEKGGSTREAKKVCLGCDVRDACLEFALTHGERFGIWGGLSERERRKLLKDRGAAA